MWLTKCAIQIVTAAYIPPVGHSVNPLFQNTYSNFPSYVIKTSWGKSAVVIADTMVPVSDNLQGDMNIE